MRRRLRRMRRGVFPLPTLMTTASLVMGCLVVGLLFDRGASSAVTGAVLILGAALLDAFDGVVARATNSTSRFGTHYDSMADVVAFGVAPAWLVYVYLLQHTLVIGMAACVMYVTCTAFRLARFNAQEEERVMGFSGLPCPAAGATVASFVILIETTARLSFVSAPPPPEVLHSGVAPWVALGMAGLGWLMISRTPYLAPKGLDFSRPRPARLVVATIIFAFTIWSLPQLLFALFLLYVFTGLMASLLIRVRWAEVVVPAWVAWAERMTAGFPAEGGSQPRNGAPFQKLPR